MFKFKKLIIVSIVWMFFSCNVTKYVGKNEFLLEEVKVNIDNKDIDKLEVTKILREQTNTKLLGLGRFNLGLYNFSGKDDNKKFNKFFKRIGEKPVLYDQNNKNKSNEIIDHWLKNKGYFNAKIKNSVQLANKKAYVSYDINPNEPHVIHNVFRKKEDLPSNLIAAEQVTIQLEDTSFIRNNYILKSSETLLQKGKLLDARLLQNERTNLTNRIRNEGYYDFSEDNIRFFVDTFKHSFKADIYFDVRYNKNSKGEKLDFKRYKIQQVFVYVNVSNQSKNVVLYDTIAYQNINFVVEKDVSFKPKIFAISNHMNPNKLFSLDDIKHTYEKLGRLNQFKFIRITFDKVNHSQSNEYGFLDCHIFLSLHKKQSYAVELEGTINSGNYGVLGNLIYRHRNLFGGAEILNVELSGGYERVETSLLNKFDSKEVGFSTNLSLPIFLFPTKISNKLSKKYNPYTNISLTYNLQSRPEYKRAISSFALSYKWESTQKISHILYPVDFGIIKVNNLDIDFFNNLNNQYFKYSFQDHIISSTRYSFIYNKRMNKLNNNEKYFRLNLEFAGNTLNLLDKILNSEKQNIISDGEIIGTGYKHFEIQYAQYIRSDLDFSFYHYLDTKNSLVYHFFLGIGYPYNNSQVMPFEKLYFSGGPNSMRAWQSRSLGPGSSNLFSKEENFSYADMRLEANLEYRFSLFKSLEGALFLDVGNIWTLTNLYNDDLAKFKFNRFYKELGVGTGLGLRLNLDVLVFRVDAGLRLLDPYLPNNNRFVPVAENWDLKDVVINFGLGYPF